MSKIAVTGATGFTGRYVVAELLKRGHRIAALVRDRARGRLPPNVEPITGDLENPAALGELVRGADAVVHLAGVIAAVQRNDYFRYNCFATRTLAEIAINAGVKQFIFASSLAAREPGLSSYGASKFAAEQALQRFEGAVMLRAPAIYGPGDLGTFPLLQQLTRLRPMIPGTRSQRFSLLYVEDFARLIADAIESKSKGVVEVSDGTPDGYGWDDLIRVAEAEMGRTLRPIFLPQPMMTGVALMAAGFARAAGKPGMVNPGKVNELYHRDWVVRAPGLTLDKPVTFARGFPPTLAWYRDHGWLPQPRGADKSSADFSHEARE